MSSKRVFIQPGKYTRPCPADNKREEFDILNALIFNTPDIPVDLLFIGDSITHYMEASQFYHKFGFVVNRGIGGDQAEITAWRFAADVIQLAPRLCILQVGANDSWVPAVEVDPETGDFTEESKKRVSDIIVNAHRNMQEQAKAAGITVWEASLIPQGEEIGNHGPRNRFFASINQRLQALAKEFNTEYVDYFSQLTEEDGYTLRKGASRDGVHPNHVGYELMRQALEPMLEKFFG